MQALLLLKPENFTLITTVPKLHMFSPTVRFLLNLVWFNIEYDVAYFELRHYFIVFHFLTVSLLK